MGTSPPATRYVTHRGQRIAYDVMGAGPAVVLQHGLFSNRRTWHDGYARVLAETYTIICIDSLGHGESDKPADPALYARPARAGDVAAVLDAEGIAQAHFIGYSMGGWIGTGMAQFQPTRLSSIVIGGWDPRGGEPSTVRTIDDLLEGAARASPQLIAWVTDAVKPGLAACWDALSERTGAIEALAALRVARLLWVGREDPVFAGLRQAALDLGNVSVLEVPGDHIAARMVHVQESVDGLRRFLDAQ
jgi:pimeloyl-ACP methyl ester carboxylesterase